MRKTKFFLLVALIISLSSFSECNAGVIHAETSWSEDEMTIVNWGQNLFFEFLIETYNLKEFDKLEKWTGEAVHNLVDKAYKNHNVLADLEKKAKYCDNYELTALGMYFKYVLSNAQEGARALALQHFYIIYNELRERSKKEI